MKPHYFLLLFLNFTISLTCFSQIQSPESDAAVDSSYAYAEIFGMASTTDRTPFWMQANQFGIVPKTGSFGSVRAGVKKLWDISTNNKGVSNWRAGVGVEVAGNAGSKNQFLLPQANASLRYKNWELVVGRKKQWVGLADSSLGTGSYAWSGNALPIPKIQIGTTRFVSVPFTKGWLAFNAFYSDGIFEKGRPVTSDLKLHQKALYLRIGNQKSRLKLYGGFNHQVQWGGKSPYETVNGQMPKGFKNYIRAVTGKAYPVGKDLTEFDYNNRIGNHLGSIDMALEYRGYEYSWYFYRQNIYEDGSLLKLTNIKDGLNGIRIKKQNSYGADFEVTDIVLEFLYTKSQGGDAWVLNEKLGRDNYFNNSQVRDGWSYFDRTIGTPFIPPTTDTKWKYPAYNYTSNSRVMVVHAGLKGTLLQTIIWQTKLSYSTNAGTYDAPFAGDPYQFSGLLSLQYNLNILGGTLLTGSFAGDVGLLYPNSYGFSLGLRKNLSLY